VIPLIERYRDRLPLAPDARVVSLYEGSTPLVHADKLSSELGVDLWLKLESMNPTGSFKDRGMTVAVSRALAQGATGVVCASTGNTAASAAAYAARAGLTAEILLPQGAVAAGKLAQARAVGARLVELRGTFDESLRAAQALGDSGRYVLVNSLNPYRIEGQKTAAFEIAEELGRVPDVLALPYGGGGNTRAYARGFPSGGGRTRFLAGACSSRRTLASAIRTSTRRTARRRRPLCATPAARSSRSPTTRSSSRGSCSPSGRASSASPQALRGSRQCRSSERREPSSSS
jgi:threonine synthase